MATYFVGQRVRIVKTASRKYLGCEARIWDHARVTGEWRLDVDGHGRRWPSGRYFTADEDQIEPILPDGHRACDDDFKRDLDRLLERQGIAA